MVPVDEDNHPMIKLIYAESRRQGITLVELAKLSGISMATIDRWKRSARVFKGKGPYLADMEKCFHALGIEIWPVRIKKIPSKPRSARSNKPDPGKADPVREYQKEREAV